MTDAKLTPLNKLRAVAWVTLWSVALSLGMALTKLLPAGLPNVLVVAIRCWLGFLVLTPVLFRCGFKIVFLKADVPLNLLRGVITCAAILCTYYAYRNLPLAYASAIGQSGPLFTAALAIVFIRERVTWRHWMLLFVGYGGVIIMVQPTVHSLDSATIAALVANILAGMSIVIARHLSANHAPVTLVGYATSVSAIIMLFVGASQWQMPTQDQWAILSIVGLLGVSSQYFYVRALKYAPASFVSPFEYTRLCMSIPIGYVMFAEVPTVSTIVGSLIIAGCAIMLLKLQNKSLAPV